MKHLISILLLCISFHLVAQIDNANLKDNWFDKDGNWVMSITNDFVIYKNQRWTFKIEKLTSDKVVYEISNGLKIKKIQISSLDSTSINVSIDKETLNKVLSNKRFVKVPIQNNKVRTSPELVTINGYVKNFDKNSEFNHVQFGFSDWLSNKYRELFTQIDSSGYFSITFLQYYPEEFSISYRYNYVRLYMVPGDTITTFIDGNAFPKNILVMGKHADIAYNIADYEIYSGRRVGENSIIEQEKSRDLDAKSFRIWRDSIQSEDSKYTTDYINKVPVYDFFKKWLSNKIKYNYLADLANNYNHFFNFGNLSDEPFDKNYLSLLDSVDFNDSTAFGNGDLYSVINNFYNLFYTLAQNRPDAKRVTIDYTPKKNVADETKKPATPKQSKKSSTATYSELNKSLNNVATKKRHEPILMSKSTVSADEIIKEVQSVKNDLIRDALIASIYSGYEKYYNSDTLAQKLLSNMKTEMGRARFYEEYSLEMDVKSKAKVNENFDDEGRTLLNQITADALNC